MACRLTGRHRVAVSTAVNPQVRRVLATYCAGPGIEIVEVPADLAEGGTGLTASEAAAAGALTDDVACLIAQQPNMFGGIEPMAELADAAHAAGALMVAVVEPTSLALLAAPGSYGADIVAAEGQPLGIPPSYGGPYVGLMAARMESVRQMPGRLVGATRDGAGPARATSSPSRPASSTSAARRRPATSAPTRRSAPWPPPPSCRRSAPRVSARWPTCRPPRRATWRPRSSPPASASVASARRTSPRSRSGSPMRAGAMRRWPSRGSWPAIRSRRDYPELADTLLLAATELTTDDDIEALVDGPGVDADERPRAAGQRRRLGPRRGLHLAGGGGGADDRRARSSSTPRDPGAGRSATRSPSAAARAAASDQPAIPEAAARAAARASPRSPSSTCCATSIGSAT